MVISEKLEQTIITTIRTLSIDAIQKANSGHPGAPMGLAPVAFTIYNDFVRHNPKNPDWPNRDRFIVSNGHASMLLYSLLHVMGYDLTLEDIKQFRQLHSRCPGHPEFGEAPGVEVTTGPLGQGVSVSVGMAIAQKWLAARFNKPDFTLLDYNIFALCGDGDLMEGVASEAASLAGHLALDNLLWFYDNNYITIEGKTDLTFSEDVQKRFEAYGWDVLQVADANDTQSLRAQVKVALQSKKPVLVVVNSHIGYGSPNKQDTAGVHGSPLGEEEVRLTKKNYGWNPDWQFYVPEEVAQFREENLKRGEEIEKAWNTLFEKYKTAYPELAKEFLMIQNGELPENWHMQLPEFPTDDKGLATRASSGKTLNAIAPGIPWLVGGSADLAPSTKTYMDISGAFSAQNRAGRNLHFGIREHAMGAIVNGLVLSKLKAFGATFFVFSDYMKPAIRLAALMKIPAIYVFTHDSIGVGEDGPTHQPIEQLAALRATPNVDVFRPADANEVVWGWYLALSQKDRPTALVLTRQNVPTFDRSKFAPAKEALKGGYILADAENEPQIILIATGSEVALCLAAYEELTSQGIETRVVSMPCTSLFERQSEEYREKVLPAPIKKRIVVEAGSSWGWERYAGLEGRIIAIDTFGKSAPQQQLMEHFGFSVKNIVQQARALLESGDEK
ncbi:transketolase [Caldithrix abyssi DSM 13497]|uniref:Transketolase n=1 Tax=Caldithrix abyssi DSM 13497 TaxID=880073 RepID=H1XQQ0_CALAY|nr:transketolase [Caldithrix abyssi]APF18309.1 transketolase [Caldithrix abyssi DSM 13497]EHO42323.1 transketolase [Caldithrix abyssi DSM 13497]